MNVRCGKCNKLFRVSDDKITGTGIKFPCSRCGTLVRISREDLEHSTLSRSAVSVPDLIEPKPEPVAGPLSPEAAEPVVQETALPERGTQTVDLAAQAAHENAPKEEAPSFVEPGHHAPASEAKAEPAVEIKPLPLLLEKPITASAVEQQPEPTPVPLAAPQQQANPTPEKETQPEPARPAPPLFPPPAAPIQPAVTRKEFARPAGPPASPVAERVMYEPIHASTPSHSRRMLVLLVVGLIIAGLAAYGGIVYFQSSPHTGNEAAHETTSIEGLQLVNPVGSLEANGDLVISGIIENAAEKERTAWYVVTILQDAQGTELAKIRLVNGKQIYTRRDYDILARRGINVQELKAKSLQEKGVVIPPKGTVRFEGRYLQPQPGMANFHTQVLPFDPVQMNKEIDAEIN